MCLAIQCNEPLSELPVCSQPVVITDLLPTSVLQGHFRAICYKSSTFCSACQGFGAGLLKIIWFLFCKIALETCPDSFRLRGRAATHHQPQRTQRKEQRPANQLTLPRQHLSKKQHVHSMQLQSPFAGRHQLTPSVHGNAVSSVKYQPNRHEEGTPGGQTLLLRCHIMEVCTSVTFSLIRNWHGFTASHSQQLNLRP